MKDSIEACKAWIKDAFSKLQFENGGIECNCFWKMAEKSGLYVRGTFGSQMSVASSELLKVETVKDTNGEFLYSVFRMK